ncbi:hypothetical protein ACLOJK_017926 [Asimina triloba]
MSSSGNIDDNAGIPEDLRCKRSDGKQWRCSALSMPDKTVCEKHYIQAKKRAANSALRASLKKAKRKSIDDTDIYLESKNEDLDLSLMNTSSGDFPTSVSNKKYREKVPKSQPYYSPDTLSRRSISMRTPKRSNDESQKDAAEMEEYRINYASRTSPFIDTARNKIQSNADRADPDEQSSKSTDSSDEAEGPTCHQCRRTDRHTVIRYPDISLEEIQRICPACRGICNCKMCLRGDNLIKERSHFLLIVSYCPQISLQAITGLDKLQHLHHLLSLVLPVLKRIHSEQSFELEVETKARGKEIGQIFPGLRFTQMNRCAGNSLEIFSRLFVSLEVHVADLRQATAVGVNGELAENQVAAKSQSGAITMKQPKSSGVSTCSEEHAAIADKLMLDLPRLFPDWKANNDGSVPCPPKDSGGCGCRSLILRRIFKMNWVAKLVKNAEEMVNGCKVYDIDSFKTCPSCNGMDSSCFSELNNSKLFQCSHREDGCDNFLFCPASQDIKLEGISHFQKHWGRGEPILVKQVFDIALASNWDPAAIWREIREAADEKVKEDNRIVKAIDCLYGCEVDIEIGQFIRGYSEGRIHENGWPEMLKLKSWPPPSALEEFLLYRRPEFISKLPLFEYIHSKWGLLNLAAKLPHDALQADVGPKLFISYGTHEGLAQVECMGNTWGPRSLLLQQVYLLMHTAEVKLQGWQRVKIEKIQKTFRESDEKEAFGDEEPLKIKINVDERSKSPDLTPNSLGQQDETGAGSNGKEDVKEEQGSDGTSCETNKPSSLHLEKESEDVLLDKPCPGAIWDIFRRQDVPILNEYLRIHLRENRKLDSSAVTSVELPAYDKAIFLNDDHKRKLKEEFKIEPWSFEQHVGEAVFVPAGCAFQVRNLQIPNPIWPISSLHPYFCPYSVLLPDWAVASVKSSVQLSLDFVSPESLEQSVRVAQEIRSLPRDHEAKLQILEVGKMSLYAVSSTIREIYKSTLDPKMELDFEDRDLTAMVAENIEKVKNRRIKVM